MLKQLRAGRRYYYFYSRYGPTRLVAFYIVGEARSGGDKKFIGKIF